MASMAGINSRPKSVSSYSTDGGEVGRTVRSTMPIDSNSFRRALSILAETTGMSERSSLKRRGPPVRYQMTLGVHAPPRYFMHERIGHVGSGERFFRTLSATRNLHFTRLPRRYQNFLVTINHVVTFRYPPTYFPLMRRTPFQELMGLEHPIVQGPFGGGLSTVALTSLVSNHGGLGSFGAHMLKGEAIINLAGELRAATDKPFALNLWAGDQGVHGDQFSHDAFEHVWSVMAPFYSHYGIAKPEQPAAFLPRFDEQVEALLEARPAVFSFVFGIPAPSVLAECRKRGILTLGAATTAAEGDALDAAGVDVILATGFEAGGHRPAFLAPPEENLIGTLPLTREIVSRVRKPVIAAGGLCDGDSVRGVLALGAGGAQLGTAFVACKESGTVDAHRQVLFSERSRRTVLTRAYSGRLARGVPNRVIAEMERHQVPPFPVQSWFFAKLKAAAMAAGDEDFLALYAGQGAPLLKHRSAGALMASLIERLQ